MALCEAGVWQDYPIMPDGVMSGRAPLFVHYSGERMTRNSLKGLYSTAGYKALELKVTSKQVRSHLTTCLLMAEKDGSAPAPVYQVLAHSKEMSKSGHYNNRILDTGGTFHALVHANPGLNRSPEQDVVDDNLAADAHHERILASVKRRKSLAVREAAAWTGKHVGPRCKMSGRVRREFIRAVYALTDPRFSQILLSGHLELRGNERKGEAWIQRLTSFVNHPGNSRLREALLADIAPFSQGEGVCLYAYLFEALRKGFKSFDPDQCLLRWSQVGFCPFYFGSPPLSLKINVRALTVSCIGVDH